MYLFEAVFFWYDVAIGRKLKKDTLGQTVMTATTGENWNTVMYAGMRSGGQETELRFPGRNSANVDGF